jgi:hypothetical protein
MSEQQLTNKNFVQHVGVKYYVHVKLHWFQKNKGPDDPRQIVVGFLEEAVY